MSLPDTFRSKTAPSDCIVWTGALNSRGYGCYAVDGVSHLAHRLAYIDAHGPIPDGLQIDHLCCNKRCVNPEHLEPVTNRENVRRARALRVGTFCANGHLIEAADDIYRNPRGRQECRACRREHSQRGNGKRALARAEVRQSAGLDSLVDA